MLNIAEIKQRLTSEAERVCRELLPHGKRKGRQWVAGDVYGASGDSVIIELEGSKAGIWADFASGAETEKGDLFALWMAVKKCSFIDAFKQAKEFLGIRDPESVNRKKEYAGKPNKSGCKRLGVPDSTPVEKYLIEERKLTAECLTAFNIASKNCGAGVDIVFPIYSGNDPKQLINLKYLGVNRTWNAEKSTFEKHTHQEENCPPGLFGWQAFDRSSTVAIITEGEIDTMTWWTWGYQCALSIPMGVNGDGWIDWDWENLEAFETIYICFDSDEPGQKAALKAANRLGLHKCRIVKLPYKDPNECLLKGCTVQEAATWLSKSKFISPAEIKSALEYREQIHNLENPISDDDEALGLKTEIFGRRLRFRPGEMTLWSGHTSHGKSSLLNQMMLYAMMANQKVAIGSFEIGGSVLIRKMLHCVALNPEQIPAADVDFIIDWMGDKLWVYEIFGIVQKPKLLELMKYSAMRHGVDHIVIDSLMKCDLNCEDYESQRIFINELACFAHENGVHIHLVGHPRKGKDDDDAPGIMDVHGGQSVVAQPDNVIVVWRNKKKEKEREANKMTDHQANVVPDTVVFVNKQRFTGEEFSQKLWFHRKCSRFTTHYGEGAPTYEDFGILKKGEV
jgi:twinkle protein